MTFVPAFTPARACLDPSDVRSLPGGSAVRPALAVLALSVTVAAATAGVAGVVVAGLSAVVGRGPAVAAGVSLLGAGVRVLVVVERRGARLGRTGVLLSRSGQPDLWSLVDDVAAATGVAPPARLSLVDGGHLSLREAGRLLGLVRGTRHLVLGAALVQVLPVDQLRAALAHELAHESPGAGRHAALAHRATAGLDRAAAHLSRTSLTGRLVRRCVRLHRRLTLPLRREQEVLADRAAARVAGRAAAEAALHAVPAVRAAYEHFLLGRVAPLWAGGTAPRNLYPAFRRAYEELERSGELRRLVEGAPPSGDDAHLPIGVRLAQVRAGSDRGAAADPRPARGLLTEADRLERQVTAWVSLRAMPQPPEQLVDLPVPAGGPARAA